mmetsp:Transcript_60688/g.143431  ORF Transcript_60688/g.143431 Transcript_60688/m.143431 type:complete len:186 (+) Transcript_60688:1152-1709(+)
MPQLRIDPMALFSFCNLTNNFLSAALLSPTDVAVSAANPSWVSLFKSSIHLDCALASSCFTCIQNTSCAFNDALPSPPHCGVHMDNSSMFPRSTCPINGTLLLISTVNTFDAALFAQVFAFAGEIPPASACTRVTFHFLNHFPTLAVEGVRGRRQLRDRDHPGSAPIQQRPFVSWDCYSSSHYES